MKSSYDLTLVSYQRQYPDSPFFETWVPKEKFLGAEFDSDGNFGISREDDGVYGIGLGAHPKISLEWRNFSIESRGVADLPPEFKAVAEWDAYWAPTFEGEIVQDEPVRDEEIKFFLEMHAPQSSVFPGNEEIEQWVTIKAEGALVAVAALCRWESGFLVASSVATHADFRGKGFGKQVMKNSLIAAHNLGDQKLSLGVMHSNTSAQELYRSMGFTLMHNFTYCERR